MSRQLTHYTTGFRQKVFPVVLILDGISGPANIGSLFRLADAFSIETLILCGTDTDMSSPRLRKTARATTGTVNFERRENCVEACYDQMKRGYTLFALEITDQSTPLDLHSFHAYEKVALVIGNENSGVDPKILRMSHTNLHITMFGKNSSMNVAQAAGIALYEITRSLPHI